MSNPWLAQFDAIAAPLFKAAGLADSATYTAPGGQPVPCTVYVDRETRVMDNNSTYSLVTTIAANVAETGVIVKGGVFTIGAEVLTAKRPLQRDESQSSWVVA